MFYVALAGGIAALLIVVFLIVVARKPGAFKVERSLQMDAPAVSIFPLIQDFHRWARWSPWEKLDPAMKRTFDGAPAGTGAKYGWSGNKKAGEGLMTILETKPDALVKLEIKFIRPFPSVATITFRLTPKDGGTHVTWTMDGTNNFMGKLFCTFVNMDKMVGGDFERGLAGIHAAAK